MGAYRQCVDLDAEVAVPNFVDYITAKGGVLGLTRALASEVGIDGITVNAIDPGSLNGVAALITGQIIHVDNGVVRR